MYLYPLPPIGSSVGVSSDDAVATAPINENDYIDKYDNKNKYNNNNDTWFLKFIKYDIVCKDVDC